MRVGDAVEDLDTEKLELAVGVDVTDMDGLVVGEVVTVGDHESLREDEADVEGDTVAVAVGDALWLRLTECVGLAESDSDGVSEDDGDIEADGEALPEMLFVFVWLYVGVK